VELIRHENKNKNIIEGIITICYFLACVMVPGKACSVDTLF
jgi:hypothetical protein